MNCDASEQQSIISLLVSMSTTECNLADNRQQKAVSCPHCSSSKIRANGKLKGVQRYLCNGCGKNFSETTGKFWFGLKKRDKVNRYLYCLLFGYSIRKSAKETGISIQTSFDWRHELLTSFSSVSVEGFEGIVESDDLFFAYSEKGNRNLDREPRKHGEKANKSGISNEKVAVVATCDRSGHKDFKVATTGRISKKDLDKVLKGKFDKAQVLCSDSHRSYTAFTKSMDITHKKFNASKGQRAVDKVYHVQNVNNLDSRLRKFMESFNGIATKYLNWFLVLEKIKNDTNRMATVATIAFASNTAWTEFKNIALNHILFIT
ncbi:IS1595 family transposase [Aquimarina sp. 2201CG1-2-11]|uniref:IS1595 family transposase n=1 Tax=Aquimarina discodermiae TaxID=3231043 RepID=UPI0034635BE1